MRVLRLVALMAACAVVTACSDLRDVFLPAHAKLTLAFPPDAQVRVAEQGVRDLLAADQAALDRFAADYASRLELRALTCLQSVAVGRFDAVSKVRSLPVSRDCLQQQDAALRTHLGLRWVGLKLAAPALRPFARLGPARAMAASDTTSVSSLDAASAAGVALVQGSNGEFVSIEIPGGKRIAALPALDASRPIQVVAPTARISPNGRIAAIRVRRSAVMFADAETGARIWDCEEIRDVLAWLPEIRAALAADAKTGTLVLLDLERGTVAPHPSGLNPSAWAIAIPSKGSDALVGSPSEAVLLQHERTAQGVESSVVKAFPFERFKGPSVVPPVLMQDGRTLVYVTGRSLATVDLGSGEKKSWSMDAAVIHELIKLDETGLLVDTTTQSGREQQPWLFDVARSTLASARPDVDVSSRLMGLAGRAGYAVTTGARTWIGDEVQADTPVAIESVLGRMNLERELAKLDSPQVAAGVDSSHVGTRAGRVEAIAVYEGKAAVHGVGMPTTPGTVEVVVRRSVEPIVLVLSSYEPVTWNLRVQPGARLAEVLVAGYNPSKVVGAAGARVTELGRSHCYKSPSCGELRAAVRRVTGKDFARYQEDYVGAAFVVGGTEVAQ